MKKMMFIGAVAALASLVGPTIYAGAAQRSNLNDGPAVTSDAGVVSEIAGGTGLGEATLRAIVDANGTLVRGTGATGVIKLGTGVYEIDFSRNVTLCGYYATIGLSGSSGASAPGFVTVVGRAGNVKGVFLETFNTAGTLTDLGYHLLISC